LEERKVARKTKAAVALRTFLGSLRVSSLLPLMREFLDAHFDASPKACWDDVGTSQEDADTIWEILANVDVDALLAQ